MCMPLIPSGEAWSEIEQTQLNLSRGLAPAAPEHRHQHEGTIGDYGTRRLTYEDHICSSSLENWRITCTETYFHNCQTTGG